MNARDRIGGGPWYNAEGDLIAQHLAQLHGIVSKLGKESAITESAEPVNAELHEILTGSRPHGTAFLAGANRTCGNWTSGTTGSAQVGYFDRAGAGEFLAHNYPAVCLPFQKRLRSIERRIGGGPKVHK